MSTSIDPPRPPAPRDARVVNFAHSEVFDRTYREGMELVEEMSIYLDGPGRAAARTLPRVAALAYAGEAMRLTTRLMQVASWLMVQRAVREGEITPEEARSDVYRLADRSTLQVDTFNAIADLPDDLQALARRSDALYLRIVRLDAGMNGEDETPTGVADQLARLKAAFRTED